MTRLLDILRAARKRREPQVLVIVNTARGPRTMRVPLRDLR